ncbi:hypothetical protein [Hyphomicrobium sp.]|uniref:hypothetical protein n=1 Tax=Hyphomicrobium sp. TaxID=82 RepID=UPI003F6EA713
MTRTRLLALGMAAWGCLGAAPALADSFWDLEAARANARAGGPVSAHDAELLERYGCLSGTNSDFCRKLSERDNRAYRVNKKRRQSRQ